MVEIGPYPAVAARAWVGHGRDLLESIVARRRELPFHLPAEIAGAFRRCFDEWWELAHRAEIFKWADASWTPTDLRRFLTYWFNLATVADDWDLPETPEPASSFYPAVVADMLDSLEAAPEEREFAGRLRAAWPGL